jgi:RNA recognition motif-containing protein
VPAAPQPAPADGVDGNLPSVESPTHQLVSNSAFAPSTARGSDNVSAPPPLGPPLAAEGPNPSIIARSLPQSATEEQLRNIFTAFGPIKDLNLKQSKGLSSFAFIEFEDAAAAAAAIAARPEFPGGRMLVEEKRPHVYRQPPRGFSGRGGGFVPRAGRTITGGPLMRGPGAACRSHESSSV